MLSNPALAVYACSLVIADGAVAAKSRQAAYKVRGGAYNILKRTDEAVADLISALSISPLDTQAQTQLGWVHVRRRDYLTALASAM